MPKASISSSALALLASAFFALCSLASPVSFEVAPDSQRVVSGGSLRIVVRALDGAGNLDATFGETLQLALLRREKPQVVISEIETTNRVVEFWNPSSEAVDLSGWDFTMADNSRIFAHLQFPIGFVAQPNEVFLFSKDPLVDAPARVLYAATRPGAWNYGVYSLRDPSGTLRDQVSVAFIDGTVPLWKGPALATRPGPWARVGSDNHFNSIDWAAVTTSSRGIVNPALQVPWSGTDVLQKSIAITFTNGIWVGNVPFDIAPGSAVLSIRDDLNHIGMSPRITVEARPQLELVFEAAVNAATERSAGPLGLGFVSIPAAVSEDINVTLSSSDTDEFQVASSVVIPAGQTKASFVVTKLDDHVADGAALVIIAADASGYAGARASLVNRDDEAGQLFVILPSTAAEDTGWQSSPGRVFIASVASADILVSLRADPILRVPESVVIRKGHSSATFNISVGNDGLYSVAYRPHVWAKTDGWPEAVGQITITDNDDATPTLFLPPVIWQGHPDQAVLSVATPRHSDVVFNIGQTTYGYLNYPRSVTLPAGATEVRFTLDPVSPGQEHIVVGFESFYLQGFVTVRSNVPQISSLIPGFNSSAVFSGQTLRLSATLGDFVGTPQFTNVVGQVSCIGSGVSFPTQAIQFTNGFWAGDIPIGGAGSGIQLEFSAAGFTNRTPPFEVLHGGTADISALDIAWLTKSDRLIASQGPATNATGRLLLLDPLNPATPLKSLDLPSPATALSISEDETVAWLILSNKTFQKVDLGTWSFAESFPASTNASEIARDLLVLPGETNVFVAVVGPTSNQPELSRVQLFRNGVANTNTAGIVNFGSLASLDLIRGRDNTEFLLQLIGRIQRYTVNDGIAAAGNAPVGGSGLNTVYADGYLYNGIAGVADPTTLAITNRFGFPNSIPPLVFPVPEISRMFALFQSDLNVYDLQSGEKLGVSSLNGLFDGSVPTKEFRWSHGFAFAFAKRILSFQWPGIQFTQPDLEVRFIGPNIVTNKPFPNGRFQWDFEVINHGPGPAPGVKVTLGDFTGIDVGLLAPEEHRLVKGPILDPIGSVMDTTAEIFSTLPDPNRENNSASVITEIKSPLVFSGFEIPMKATALISAPDLSRVYAGFSALPHVQGQGVAIFNPETGLAEKILASSTAPKVLVVSADNSFLYGLTATNEVTRWNLQAGQVDQLIQLTNETIFSMVTPLTNSGQVVLATDKRVIVHDGATVLSGKITRTADFRCLGFAGTNLWMSETANLYRLRLSESGVTTTLGPIPITLFTQNYQFYADARRLYFDSYNFDISSKTIVGGGVRNGLLFYPESGTLLELFGNHAISRDSATLAPIADDFLPLQIGGQSCRFGDRGVAGIGLSQQLIFYKVSSIPLSVPLADLELTVAPPANPYSNYPLEWQFTVRNLSANPAANARLVIDRPQDLREPQFDPTNGVTAYLTTAFDLGTLDPQASATVKLSGFTFGGNNSVAARVVANSPDPNTNNNSFASTFYFRPPPIDLEMKQVAGPTEAHRGDVITYTFVVRNDSAMDLPAAFLELYLGGGAELPDGIPTGISLAAGETKSIDVRVKFTQPGLIRVAGVINGNITDETQNNSGALMVTVKDPAAQLGSLVFPMQRLLAWSPARQEIIASFPDSQWSVFGLDPATLQPRWTMALPWLPSVLAPTDDARFVWVALAGQGVCRVNLELNSIDINFNVSTTQAQIWAIGSVPGRADTVLVSYDPGFTGQNRVQVFENGAAKPSYFSGSGRPLFTQAGRGFIYGSSLLREFSLTSNGLIEINNFDSLAPYGDNTATVVGETLFFSNGRSVNMQTRQVIDQAPETESFVADAETGAAYREFYTPLSFGRAHLLEHTSLSAGLADWLAPMAEAASLIPIGTNGVLASGEHINIYNVDPATKAVDLAVTLSATNSVPGPQVEFLLNVAVTNRSIWRAANALLQIQLAPSTSIFLSADWVPTNLISIPLGAFAGGTNLSFRARTATSGDLSYTAAVTNDIVELAAGDNVSVTTVSVAPVPIVLVDDVAQTEDTPVRLWLSSPAASDLNVTFTAAPISGADSSDLTMTTGSFLFRAGSTTAALQIVAPDSTPEFDEGVVLQFSSDLARLVRTQAVVMAINDDFPRLTVPTGVGSLEGDIGLKTVAIPLTLTAAPFASEVEYETIAGSAIAGVDFVPQSGRLRFAAGETSKTVTVQIIGNTVFEPSKTFTVAFKNPVSLMLLSSTATMVTIRNDDPPPPFGMSISQSGGSLAVRFEARAGVTYQLENRTNITVGSWTTTFATPGISGTNGQFTVTKPNGLMPSFYRIRATAN